MDTVKHAGPTRYKVGDKVRITPDCITRMESSHRSVVHPQYPSRTFITLARELAQRHQAPDG